MSVRNLTADDAIFGHRIPGNEYRHDPLDHIETIRRFNLRNPSAPVGWLCPKCGRGVAPHVETCGHGT